MVTVTTKDSLVRELEAIEDEQSAKRVLTYMRRLRKENRKGEILAGLKEGMQALKKERGGGNVTGQFRDLKELLNEL